MGLGILGVGIEFEREKGISRVEFHPHHHGGGAGSLRGGKIKANPQGDLPKQAPSMAVYRRTNSRCDAIEKGPTRKCTPADFSIEMNSTQIRKSGMSFCWSMI